MEGLTALPATVPYLISKFAVMGLSQGMWVEGTGLGVRGSVGCPGFTRTPIFEKSELVNTDRREMMTSLAAYEKFSMSPGQCARTITFPYYPPRPWQNAPCGFSSPPRRLSSRGVEEGGSGSRPSSGAVAGVLWAVCTLSGRAGDDQAKRGRFPGGDHHEDRDIDPGARR